MVADFYASAATGVRLLTAFSDTDAYGNILRDKNLEGFEGQPHGYTGQEREPDYDGMHFGARLYLPDLGRFLQIDPADQFWNSYSYVGNTPVMTGDSNGMVPDWVQITNAEGTHFKYVPSDQVEDFFENVAKPYEAAGLGEVKYIAATHQEFVDYVAGMGMDLSGRMSSMDIDEVELVDHNYYWDTYRVLSATFYFFDIPNCPDCTDEDRFDRVEFYENNVLMGREDYWQVYGTWPVGAIGPGKNIFIGTLEMAGLSLEREPMVIASNVIKKSRSLAEKKALMGLWNKATFRTLAQSLKYHFNRHKKPGEDDLWSYLARARNFKQRLDSKRLSGYSSKLLSDGVTRKYWKRGGGEYMEMRGGKIISYGINKF